MPQTIGATNAVGEIEQTICEAVCDFLTRGNVRQYLPRNPNTPTYINADLITDTSEYGTALTIAASYGLSQVVRRLLLLGHNVEEPDSNGALPIHSAAKNGQIEMVRQFLQEKSDQLNLKSRNGYTILILAIIKKHASLVRFLLREGADPNLRNDVDGLGRSPLHYAADIGNEEILNLLLDSELIDANASYSGGLTPLHLACRGDIKAVVVEVLLASTKVIQDSRDIDGRLTLDNVLDRRNITIAKLLWKGVKHAVCGEDHDHGRLWEAILMQDPLALQLLETEGINLKKRDHFGRTVLCWAANTGNSAVVELLLGLEGVEVNAQDSEGSSALKWAMYLKDETAEKMLKRPDIDLNTSDKRGMTPLFLAALLKREIPLRLILTHDDVDVNALWAGVSALMLVANGGWTLGVELLLTKKEINTNAKGERGLTALHWAVKGIRSDTRILGMLLATPGIEAFPRDDSGDTPLGRGVGINNYEEVLCEYEKYGHDVSGYRSERGRRRLREWTQAEGFETSDQSSSLEQ